jgi:hypothetical protein
MVETHRNVNNALKKRSIFLPPSEPDFLNNIVAIEEMAAVEQYNTLLELFSFREYSKFRLNFQLKKYLSGRCRPQMIEYHP